MRAISFLPNAFDEYNAWSQEDKRVHRKIIELITVAARTPFDGIGKPEPLKYKLKNCWSRRIDQKHRLVYQVTDESIIIVSCRDHYPE
jgi:toxin YoeB